MCFASSSGALRVGSLSLFTLSLLPPTILSAVCCVSLFVVLRGFVCCGSSSGVWGRVFLSISFVTFIYSYFFYIFFLPLFFFLWLLLLYCSYFFLLPLFFLILLAICNFLLLLISPISLFTSISSYFCYSYFFLLHFISSFTLSSFKAICLRVNLVQLTPYFSMAPSVIYGSDISSLT